MTVKNSATSVGITYLVLLLLPILTKISAYRNLAILTLMSLKWQGINIYLVSKPKNPCKKVLIEISKSKGTT